MRILFVALSVPNPPTNGHRLRRWGMLRTLAADGHDVSLVSFVDPGEQVDQKSPLRKLCRRIDLLPTPRSNWQKGKASLGRISALFYAPAGQEEPCAVLFQDGMDWYPNRDTVEFFIKEILPVLCRLAPDVTFRVAGRGPTGSFRRRLVGVRHVEFTGPVPDMWDEIAKATVCVVPLRIGSGTRLKILEAASMAKPIVSTTIGAGIGLHERNGHRPRRWGG